MKRSLPALTCFLVLSAVLSGCSSNTNNVAPTPIQQEHILSLSGDQDSTIILTESGQLFGAGRGVQGMLGLGLDDTDYLDLTHVPINFYGNTVQMASIKHKYSLEGSDHTSFAVSKAGLLFGTGINSNGQMGFGLVTDILANYTPIPLQTAAGTSVIIRDAQGSQLFSVALDSTGKLWGTGKRALGTERYNSYGDDTQIGGSSAPELDVWTAVTVRDGQSIVTFKTIATSLLSGYYVDSNGQLWVAGDNSDCELGVNNCATTRIVPVITKSAFTGQVNTIAASLKSAALIDNHGDLWVAGNNVDGAIGAGTTPELATFTKLNVQRAGKAVTFKEVSLSNDAIVALSSDGYVYVSGLNTETTGPTYTILGLPDTTASANTLTLINLQDAGKDVVITHVHTTLRHTMLSDDQGNLWVVGQNNHGQLGTGNTTDYKVFTKIAGPKEQ